MRTGVRLLGILAALVVGIFAGVNVGDAQAPIKLGVLTELSGVLGTVGESQRNGLLLYLNQSGGRLAGRRVEVVSEDTTGDPATANAKVRKLVEVDKVNILFGPISSATVAAIRDYVVRQQVPTLIEGTVDELTHEKYIFRVTFSANPDSYLQGFLAAKAGFRKAVTLAANFIAGQVATEYFEKGFNAGGGTVIQKLLPRLGATDFAPFINQFSREADVAIVLEPGADGLRFIKQYAEHGKRLPLYGYPATVDETLLPAQGTAAVGFVGAAPYFSTIETEANKGFVRDFQASFKVQPTWFAAGGYIAGQVMDQAAQKVNGQVENKEAFLRAMKEVKLTTPAGPFRFDKNNNPIQPRYIMQIQEVAGKVQPVILGVIPEFIPEVGPPTLPPTLKLPR